MFLLKLEYEKLILGAKISSALVAGEQITTCFSVEKKNAWDTYMYDFHPPPLNHSHQWVWCNIGMHRSQSCGYYIIEHVYMCITVVLMI